VQVAAGRRIPLADKAAAADLLLASRMQDSTAALDRDQDQVQEAADEDVAEDAAEDADEDADEGDDEDDEVAPRIQASRVVADADTDTAAVDDKDDEHDSEHDSEHDDNENDDEDNDDEDIDEDDVAAAAQAALQEMRARVVRKRTTRTTRRKRTVTRRRRRGASSKKRGRKSKSRRRRRRRRSSSKKSKLNLPRDYGYEIAKNAYKMHNSAMGHWQKMAALHEMAMLSGAQSPISTSGMDLNADLYRPDAHTEDTFSDGQSINQDLGLGAHGEDDDEEEMTQGAYDDPWLISIHPGLAAERELTSGDGNSQKRDLGSWLKDLQKRIVLGNPNMGVHSYGMGMNPGGVLGTR
jgi:hypothetical protein